MTVSQKKSFFLLFVIVFLTGVLGITLFAMQQQQNQRSKAVSDKVNLTLSATPNPAPLNGTVTVNILMNTNQYSVSAAELRFSYPSDVVEPVSITGGTFLPTILNPGATTATYATITVGSGTAAQKGSGVIATLTLKMKKANGTGVVAVDGTNTNIAGMDASGSPVATSILGDAGTVTLTTQSSSTNTPTQTPTPKNSPTNTPTKTPTPSIKNSPTSTPTKNPTPTINNPTLTPTSAPSINPTPIIKIITNTPTPIILSVNSSTPTPIPSTGGFGGIMYQIITPTPLPTIPEQPEVALADRTSPDAEILNNELLPESEVQAPEEMPPFEETPALFPSPQPEQLQKKQSWIPYVIGYIALFVGIGGAYLFIKRRQSKKPEEKTPIPRQPENHGTEIPPINIQ